MTKTPKRNHICIVCGCHFMAHQRKQKRCKSCQKQYRNTGRNGYKYKRVCIDCGKKFRSSNGRAKRCNYCWHNANCKICGKHFERTSQTKIYCSDTCGVWAKADKRHGGTYVKCLRRDAFSCRKCGSRKALTVHHIDHSGGYNVRIGKANNSLSNLVTLCEQCHYDIYAKMDTYLYEKYIEDVHKKLEKYIGGKI